MLFVSLLFCLSLAGNSLAFYDLNCCCGCPSPCIVTTRPQCGAPPTTPCSQKHSFNQSETVNSCDILIRLWVLSHPVLPQENQFVQIGKNGERNTPDTTLFHAKEEQTTTVLNRTLIMHPEHDSLPTRRIGHALEADSPASMGIVNSQSNRIGGESNVPLLSPRMGEGLGNLVNNVMKGLDSFMADYYKARGIPRPPYPGRGDSSFYPSDYPPFPIPTMTYTRYSYESTPIQ